MRRILTWLLTIVGALAFLPVSVAGTASRVQVKPLYTLANFSGPVRYDLVRLDVDRDNGEILILNPRDGDIRVFNGTGMEVYRTSPYTDLGMPVDLAVREVPIKNLNIYKRFQTPVSMVL